MIRPYPDIFILKLLLIFGVMVFLKQIGSAQANTPDSIRKQLDNYDTKVKSLNLDIINEFGASESFIIDRRQVYYTNYGIQITNWTGRSTGPKERYVHLSNWGKYIAGNITSETKSYDILILNNVYKWLPSRKKKDHQEPLSCFLSRSTKKENTKGNARSSTDLLTYKLALTSTPQFSAIHGNTITEVLVSLMSYVNQINTIYERELGIRLELADDSEKLIFLNGQNDPFSNQIGVAVSQHIQILNDSLGIDNYDIGHLLRVGGGGLANIEVACTDNKGFGVSGFEDASSFNLLLAHEIGHQIGAGHTWNSCSSTLNQIQRSPSSAMEPGSGNTIMSYAGLCGANNSSNEREPYFHPISIDQVRIYTRSGAGSACPQISIEPNSPPSIIEVTSTEKAIPKSTPFRLTGNALDADDDILTHTWDQVDQGDAVNLGKQSIYNPIIRSRPPSINKERFIPDLVNLANGVEDKAELLPSLERALEFRYSARDNHSGNGNISGADFTLRIDSSAGPFVIIDNGGSEWYASGTHPVEWDIANTNNNAVDCQFVDILIDYDGLLEFKDTLAHQVPNDGLHYIQLPDTITTNARLMIRAADNIFFDISDAPFEISRTSNADFQVFTDTSYRLICDETLVSFNIYSIAINGFSNPIRYTAGPLPNGLFASITNNDLLPGNAIRVDVNVNSGIERKEYEIPINAFAANGSEQTINFTLQLIDTQLSSAQPLSPSAGEVLNIGAQQFSWIPDQSTENNILDIANSPLFEAANLVIQDSTSSNRIKTPSLPSGIYFWKIKSKNQCSIPVFSKIQTFGIKATTCTGYSSSNSFNISNGIDSISSSINVTINAPIQSITLSNIEGNHSYIGDLTFVLITPNGQRLKLVQNECNESKGFDFGIDSRSDRLRCSINRGLSYQPADKFDPIIGMSSQGDWTLRIIDNIPGDGGQLTGWELNICSYDNPSNPVLITADTLRLKPGQEKEINSSILDYRDDDNSSTEVRYIITAEVTKGYLILGTDTLRLGDSFTQLDIDNNIITYGHKNNIEEMDELSYVVTDGQGYISPIKTLSIAIKNNVNITSIKDALGIQIYPNPVRAQLLIEIPSDIKSDLKARLYHIDGKLVLNKVISRLDPQVILNLSAFPPGVYLLNLTSNKASGSEKIIIQR